MAIRYLSVEEVTAINVAMIQKYSPGEQIGIKSQPLLEAAVYRPQQSAFGEDAYPTIFKMGQKQAEDFTVSMVEHAYSFEELVDIIKAHSSHKESD